MKNNKYFVLIYRKSDNEIFEVGANSSKEIYDAIRKYGDSKTNVQISSSTEYDIMHISRREHIDEYIISVTPNCPVSIIKSVFMAFNDIGVCNV